MPCRRLVRCLICPAFLVAIAPGCQGFYAYRPVAVQVRDADTKQPIHGADVAISYPNLHPNYAPWDSVALTGDDGIVHLRAAPTGPAGVLLEVRATGCLPEYRTLAVAEIDAIQRPGWFEDTGKRPVNFVVELVTKPGPSVELVIPNTFRGLIKAEIVAREGVACAPRQRVFNAVVPASGEVQIIGPPLLARVTAQDFRAVYSTGEILRTDAKGLDMGFWPLKRDDRFVYFVVGTQSEFEALRRAELQGDLPGSRTGKGSSGSGGKHGGRKGNANPAGSDTNP
jgi:hypothetical protein